MVFSLWVAPEGWGQGSSQDPTQRDKLKLLESMVGSLERLNEGGHLSSPIKAKQETFGFASTKVPEIS